ncbi:hypothetical protein [Kroppenstedtia sanguinis]|uniref:Uncharacterized protein n=1 Tax=Kroppenstedtia sanguinis TaxID=1380684 RepID=A0ABW4C5X9_9BACL
MSFHFWDFGIKEDPAADLAAHRELLAEAQKGLRWAEHIGDHRKAISWYEEIAYRQAEIRRLTARKGKQAA